MRDIDLDAEREFENRKALGEDVRAHQDKYYWATRLATEEHLAKTYEAITGKTVLEIGCASGRDAKAYAQYAKEFVGVDISDEAIKNAEALNLPNAEFICTDGHTIEKPDSSFDVVIVNSLLHHLDLNVTFEEIRRLLRPGGVLIFREPLGTNPAFQIYRFFTPSARTVDERPFTFADLELMREYFHFENVRWFGFSNILSAFMMNDSVRGALTSADNALSRTPLKYFYWQFAGVATVKGK